MNVSLTHELEEFVNNKIQSGTYTSASEVVRDGLRLLVERDSLYQIRLEELRKEIQQRIDSREAGPFDPEAILRKVSERIGKKAAHQE
jgi:antitoxin ParD1/3/4